MFLIICANLHLHLLLRSLAVKLVNLFVRVGWESWDQNHCSDVGNVACLLCSKYIVDAQEGWTCLRSYWDDLQIIVLRVVFDAVSGLSFGPVSTQVPLGLHPRVL